METEIFKTPIGGNKVEIKKWITGKDVREIRSVYLNSTKIGIKGTSPDVQGITGELIEKAENKTIEVVVVSIDGEKEGIVEKILALRSDDYNFVMEKIREVTNEKKSE
jgi:hypothetical protein